jgi:hypothetical protein
MALKTARTSLYFVDPNPDNTSGAAVVAVGCVTNLTGIEAGRDQLENTCLEDSARSYEAGLATPGAATFTINFDPQDESHRRVYELWQSGETLQWAVGLSDGPAFPAALIPPEIDTDETGFNLPDTRSWITFEGYIANVPLDLALNALVTASVTLQISDFPVVTPRIP